MAHLDGLASKPTDVVLFGIEAHVCITQVIIYLSQDLALFPSVCFFVVASTAVGEVLPAAAVLFSLYPTFIASLFMAFAPCRVLSYRWVLLIGGSGRAAFSRAQTFAL